MPKEETIYRVSFANRGEVYEIYARNISHSDLMGFVEIEGLIWGTGNGIVIDPVEERLRNEFKGVKCIFIPLHTINRIDEVEKTGLAKITSIKGGSNVMPFPLPIYTPGSDKEI